MTAQKYKTRGVRYNCKVTMEDGHVELVEAKSEELARVQCAHLRLIHGSIDKVEDYYEKKKVKTIRGRRQPNPVIKKFTMEEKIIPNPESPPTSIMLKTPTPAEEKALSLTVVFGKDRAPIVCVEMLAEVETFGDRKRLSFWYNVMAALRKNS